MSEVNARIRSPQQIRYFTIHHSAVTPGAANISKLKERAAIYDRGHKNTAVQNSWASKTGGELGYQWISYHYLIDASGNLLHVQDVKYERVHAGDTSKGSLSHNRYGIAVCFDGDFQKESINSKQLETCAKLIVYLEQQLLKRTFGEISGHKDTSLTGTSCPGNNLYNKIASLKSLVNNFRNDTNMFDETKYKQRISQLEKDKNDLQATNNSQNQKINSLEEKVNNLSSENGRLRESSGTEKVKEIQKELTDANIKIAELKRELNELKKSKAKKTTVWDTFKKFLTTDV